jgi:hypothetical protein
MTPFGAPTLQDVAAAGRRHPGHESMGPFSAAIVWLVGPFHDA